MDENTAGVIVIGICAAVWCFITWLDRRPLRRRDQEQEKGW
ncbi:hypothetical protein [Streptomyces sp. NPDC087272]